MLKKALVTLAVASVALVAADKLNGAGASFPANAYYAWAKGYEEATGNRINYQAIGSGGGIKQMKAKTVDFGGTDAPLKEKDINRYKLLQFPTLVGAIVFAYNVPGVSDGEIKLSNSVIEGIMFGDIKTWNDPKIMADNAGVNLPDEKITVVHRSDGSGTTFNFTAYMNKISKRWEKDVGMGKAVAWPTGIGGKGNEGVTNLIKQTPGALGYVELSYKERMGMAAAQVKSAAGTWVAPSNETAANAAAYAKWDPAKHFFIDLSYQPGEQTWPITAGTFGMLHASKKDMSKKVTAFFDWAYKNGDAQALELGFVPLPEVTKNMIRKYWKDNGVM